MVETGKIAIAIQMDSGISCGEGATAFAPRRHGDIAKQSGKRDRAPGNQREARSVKSQNKH
jgi:hypothetical protein